MNDELQIGQVLSLKIRFNNAGDVAKSRHPYLILAVATDTIELAQIDSLQGKEYKAAFKTNKTVFCDNPMESVIDKDSYVQLDNKITVEKFSELVRYRRQPDKLSEKKLRDVIDAYFSYHKKHHLDELKIVYISKEELVELQK